MEKEEKDGSNMSDVLFTLKHCESITFSSIAFIIHSSSLSHSLFSCIHSSLTLSSISITPSDSDSTTSIPLSESLIVCSFDNLAFAEYKQEIAKTQSVSKDSIGGRTEGDESP